MTEFERIEQRARTREQELRDWNERGRQLDNLVAAVVVGILVGPPLVWLGSLVPGLF